MKRNKHGQFAKGNRGGPGRLRNPDSDNEIECFTPCGCVDPRASAITCFSVGACFLGSEGKMREGTNAENLDALETMFKQACFECLIPGFFGEIVVKIPIQDGTIQTSRRVSIMENRRGVIGKPAESR